MVEISLQNLCSVCCDLTFGLMLFLNIHFKYHIVIVSLLLLLNEKKKKSFALNGIELIDIWMIVSVQQPTAF